ncbi:MAG: T9SS type A sorting domain-containing protein [Ignavibacteria bacterium]|nr:T9SS type A sorting domain-containing protein [Ignavibacteria bacterium]
MKKIFLYFFIILFYLIVTNNSHSNYTTPNSSVSWNLNDLVTNSGGVVTFSSGTYFVNDTLTVSSSDTLKILTNATVKFAFNVIFFVNGTLIVNPADSVKFTSIDTTQKFMDVRLDDQSDASVINKLIFEYSYNGFRMLDSSPIIENSIFRFNCNGNTTTSTAISLFRSNVTIRNCKIYRNYRVGIAGGTNIANAPQILNNEIFENNILNGNVPQINLGTTGSTTAIIRGNLITGGNSIQTGAIAVAASLGGTINVIIENNVIKRNRYGITIQAGVSNAIIRGNIIDTNNIQNSPNLGGSGINIVGSGVTAIVSKNYIRGNLWGITTQQRANLILGDLSNSDTNYIGLNQIYGNHNSGIFYDLYNNTINPIKAENNYWGTTNIDTVEAHIVHQPDNDSGFVDYLPIWTLTGISPINTEIPSKYMLYDAYPNPFNPETNIRFDIPESGNVKITVYDLTGREIDVLFDQFVNSGKYEIKFNGESYSSGVYFYSIRTDKFANTKKLVLVK